MQRGARPRRDGTTMHNVRALGWRLEVLIVDDSTDSETDRTLQVGGRAARHPITVVRGPGQGMDGVRGPACGTPWTTSDGPLGIDRL